MTRFRLQSPATTLVSLLAGLATWVTLLAWRPFAERSSDYLVPLFGACLLVAVSGMLLRAARLPALAVLAVQVVVLGLWLHHRWAGGWLPTPASLRTVEHLLHASFAAAQTYASPVPRSVAVFAPVMVLAGTGTALLVDFLACGLRRAPLAGLPLLAAYTAPVSILAGGVSWLQFLASAVCFLFLVAADEAHRLAHWGRQLSGAGRVDDSQTTTVTTAAVWSSARKIGLTATGVAVLLPLALPTFTGGLLSGSGHGYGPGNGRVDVTNPMVDVRRDLVRGGNVPLLRVTTDDPDPSYLRLTVLDSFDGTAWRPSDRKIPLRNRAAGRVPGPPGLADRVRSTSSQWTVQVSSAFRSRWLPTPYPVTSIEVPGDWRFDTRTLDFVSAADGQTTAGLGYRLQARQLHPTARQLDDAGPAPSGVYLPETALPKSLPASVRTLARKVTAGASTDFARAVRLQRWFRQDGGFTYSLARAPGNGIEQLTRFLGHGPGSRTGYCEQFAAAMALMGRALGIPSRVVVGFLQPQQVGPDSYVYSSHDMHAWPEMYFDGVGWVRFEPTPPARGTAVPGYTTHKLPSEQPALPTTPAHPQGQQNRFNHPSAAPGHKGLSAGQHATGTGGSTPAWAVLLGAGLLVVLLAVLPRSARGLRRRRRWARAAGPGAPAGAVPEAGWAEVRDTALDLGLGWDDEMTLRRRATDLVRTFGRAGEDDGTGPVRGPYADPEATAALDRLVRAVEHARFARPEAPPPDKGAAGRAGRTAARETVVADVARVEAALAAGVGRRRRLRAAWLPASLSADWWSRRPRPSTSVPEPGLDHAV